MRTNRNQDERQTGAIPLPGGGTTQPGDPGSLPDYEIMGEVEDFPDNYVEFGNTYSISFKLTASEGNAGEYEVSAVIYPMNGSPTDGTVLDTKNIHVSENGTVIDIGPTSMRPNNPGTYNIDLVMGDGKTGEFIVGSVMDFVEEGDDRADYGDDEDAEEGTDYGKQIDNLVQKAKDNPEIAAVAGLGALYLSGR